MHGLCGLPSPKIEEGPLQMMNNTIMGFICGVLIVGDCACCGLTAVTL
jgi:hypothetical protein